MASRSDRTARVCAMRLELSGPLLESLTGNANLFRESGPDNSKRASRRRAVEHARRKPRPGAAQELRLHRRHGAADSPCALERKTFPNLFLDSGPGNSKRIVDTELSQRGLRLYRHRVAAAAAGGAAPPVTQIIRRHVATPRLHPHVLLVYWGSVALSVCTAVVT